MLRTLEATIDEKGNVTLHEKVVFAGQTRALVTILDEPVGSQDAYILSESALADGWSGPEADEAWMHLAQLPDLDEEKH